MTVAAAHPALLRLRDLNSAFCHVSYLCRRWTPGSKGGSLHGGIPLVSCTAPAGILVVFVDPTRHSRLDVSLRISCVIQNELCRTASSLDIRSRSTEANEAKSGKRWPIGKLFSLNNAKIPKRIVAIVQRAECNLAILRARSA
jgi:hypothetical protein